MACGSSSSPRTSSLPNRRPEPMRSPFLSPAAMGALLASSCDVAAVDANTEAVIPLDLTGPRPRAQLTIGDNPPVTAIFDSGAAASVVRRSFAERIGMLNLGQAMVAAPGGPPTPGFRTRLTNARLGDARFPEAMAVAFDMALPALDGVDAVISPSVFSGRLVRFEFAQSRVRLLPRAQAPTSQPAPYVGA